MRVLFLDCFSGISGDMTVGALCDLGVKPSTLEWELSKVEIGDYHMHFQRKQRQAIEGVKFSIHEGLTHTHDQDEPMHGEHCCHGHGEHTHEHGHAHTHEEKHEHKHEHSDHCCHGHGEHTHDHSHAHGEQTHSHVHSHEHGDDCCRGHSHEHKHEHGDHCCHGHGEHTHSHSHPQGEPIHFHAHPHDHGHSHAHGAHGHLHGHSHAHGEADHVHGRTFSEIRKLIEESDLSSFVKKHSVSIFYRIAVAEGRIHGKPPEEVGFHEVGALDSIADIICACVGIEELGVEAVYVSPLADGRGWVKCAHGLYPIPAIATLEILKGIPVGQIDEPFEFITPTGAAIVAEFGKSFGTMPQIQVEKIGYGIGTRVLQNRPNVLRAVVGTLATESAPSTATAAGYQTDTISRIETNLDDISPEITGATLGKLLDAGALDAFLTPIQMKKNRSGVKLTVLCEEVDLPTIANLLFKETTAFGIRMEQVQRWKLDRKFVEVSTPHGPITVKIGSRGDEVLQVAPEFESCRAASERTGQPLRALYEAAIRAYREGLEA